MGKWDDIAAGRDRERSDEAVNVAAARVQIDALLHDLNSHLTAEGAQIAAVLAARKVPRVQVGASGRLLPRKGWRITVALGSHETFGTRWDLDTRGRWVHHMGAALPVNASDADLARYWSGQHPKPGEHLRLHGLDSLYLDDQLRPVIADSLLHPELLDSALEQGVRRLL